MVTGWEIKHRLYRAINAHDVSAVLDNYTPEAVFVAPSGVLEGHEQIAWFWEQLFKAFPDLQQTPWLEVACDDPAVTEWTLTGTHQGPFFLPNGRELEATGRRVAIRGSCIAHVAHGKIVTHREYFDQLELYCQLGFGMPDVCDPPR
ncbi:ester cyclase [Nonomuraea sp. KM90]|uniref:ester cyclase n=1 Tax=Nonomuraea sp. KM90 TaxID=3457428 RepID=UPI003FCEE536